ncbi:hypothetical protein FDP41_008043 [Naegleria fowleri]|uniref:Uncharacterized protein n=1 Tax=Naegleria fowleri TaxID=5763 RepID=A0A6A5CFI3_NAEFO|nr:uncharacterized protein FDP41_008043 [Naegleria fowleri]KAF0984128.1 hypothetical protein FDP41_008043 [Naegleria fowleri]CAG4717122.1 unnamed protein product [Naegleria fowleri]
MSSLDNKRNCMGNEITQIIRSERFEHKICGMTSSLVRLLRTLNSSSFTTFQSQHQQQEPSSASDDDIFQPLISKLRDLLQRHFEKCHDNNNSNPQNNLPNSCCSEGNICEEENAQVNVGFAFGNVAKTLYAHNVNLNENDVCVCLIMDSQLDIDCKMVTAVRKNSSLVSSNDKSIIWKLLYKYSFQ